MSDVDNLQIFIDYKTVYDLILDDTTTANITYIGDAVI
jgi:hypothetical protein